MEHGGIYHRNRRFLLLVILLVIITMAVFAKNREAFVKLSPSEENTFVSNLVPGEVCKCVYVNAEIAQLAQERRVTTTSIEHPTPAECLQQTPCQIEANVNQGNNWQSQTFIGTSAYVS